MKTCNKCGVELVPEKNWMPSMVKGRNYCCKPCHGFRCDERKKERLEDYNTKRRETYKAKGSAGADYQRDWKKKNPGAHYKHQKRWVERNPEQAKKTDQKYQDSGGKNADRMKRIASQLERTVSWTNQDEIKTFYAGRPKGHHVDHFYPLQGETVSGLHVLENLQYLTASENASKRNRHPDEWLASKRAA
jgi:hypothetical protein